MRRTALVFVTTIVGSLLGPGSALADGPGTAAPAVEPMAGEARTTVVDVGPNRLLLATGAAGLAFAYAGSLWVGATSTRTSDRSLVVPFAGPWLALGTRGSCGGGVSPCGQETAYGALLVADGLVQAASAVQIALAFFHRELRTSTEPVIRSARVTLAPTRPSGGGVGFAAIGQF
jgi:hypothetical protein